MTDAAPMLQPQLLAELAPGSPRIRPTLARIAWLQREPGMVATEMRRAAV